MPNNNKGVSRDATKKVNFISDDRATVILVTKMIISVSNIKNCQQNVFVANINVAVSLVNLALAI